MAGAFAARAIDLVDAFADRVVALPDAITGRTIAHRATTTITSARTRTTR
jgi:hypothetical protein